MELKPTKSWRISIVKGQVTGEQFYNNEKLISTILEKPIKSLCQWYSADLKDTMQLEQLHQDTIKGLKPINSVAFVNDNSD